MTPQLAVSILPALVAWSVIALLRRSRRAERLRDTPNERSLHSTPTPRVGGLGLLAGALPAAFFFADGPVLAVIACAGLLGAISLLDDLHSLPIAVRLPAHGAAAVVAVLSIAGASGTQPGLGIVEAGLAVVAIVWMTNLYNFMDGSDGLAGGMAVIGFGTLAAAAWQAHEPQLALACAAFASAAAGFLPHNFPPAHAFLGDAGSVPLGFLAGALSLDGIVRGAWEPWFPLLVFSPFIVDATATLLRRIARGEPFWKAHRSHQYQRLVLAGWTPRRLALSAYALMGAAAASAWVAGAAEPIVRGGIILFWAAAYASLFIAIERRTRAA
ncbi:MAG: MraY family glycosyltransferase [Usitatibacter sp.]